MFLILSVVAIADLFAGIEIPIPPRGDFRSAQEENDGRWRNGVNAGERSQMCRGKLREPSSEVLLLKLKRLVGEQQRINERAPHEGIPVDRVVELPRAQEVLCQDNGLFLRIP